MTDKTYDLDTLYDLLSRSYVTRDDGELWTLADCHRWLVAASDAEEGGYPVADEATVRRAFPEAFRPRRTRARAIATTPVDRLPAYIPSAHLARAVGWPARRMLRRLRRVGIVREGAGQPYVTKDDVSARMPELLAVYARWFTETNAGRKSQTSHSISDD
jgi:hypothetical protein